MGLENWCMGGGHLTCWEPCFLGGGLGQDRGIEPGAALCAPLAGIMQPNLAPTRPHL